MADILTSAFDQLTPALRLPEDAALYPHQLAVAEALLSGRRVVLRAPSGSGKTLTAWFPWLASRLYSCDFPSTLCHIVPGGTLLGNLTRQLSALAHAAGGLHAGVQTEGDAFDPLLLSDAILSTVDQMLSVALHRPLGLHPTLSNMNAGVLLGAYLIFDEFPLSASRETLALWLGLLRRYYPITPCLFTGSVLPQPLLARIARVLDAEFIDAGDFAGGGLRQWCRAPAMSADAILRHPGRRTIVVCNTVRGAQMLYRALVKAAEGTERAPEIFLLHQYQLYRHRLPITDRVAWNFGRVGGSGRVLLVTTSGIEIGADLSADTLITDPAPPDALLRRAGRCARFAGQEGQVIVSPVTEFAPGETYPAPPWEDLLGRLADGTPKSSADELAALDALWESALPSQQPALLRQLPDEAEMDAAPGRILTGEENFPARLFPRVSVCLHNIPETVPDPFELERFSMAASSLERGWRQWQNCGCPGEWFALIPHWPANMHHSPSWSPVRDPAEFRAAARLIVLNAEAVSYDPVLGLELAQGTPYQSERMVEQQTTWSPFDQHVQSFEEHAVRTLAAFDAIAPWFRYLLRHLGRHWRMPSVELEQLLRLTILWHDAAKLTADWQRCAHRWQEELIRRPVQMGVLARVDFAHQRHGAFPCPEHAYTSGRVLARSLGVLLGGRTALLEGALAAISHHHGVSPDCDLDPTPHPEAWATLMGLAGQIIDERQLRRMDRVGWGLQARSLPDIPLLPPNNPDAWMAYSLLVRAIRLADREVALADLLA